MGGRGGGGDEKQHYKHMFYDLLLLGDLCTENIIKKKNGQVLSKPQMRLLLKKTMEVPFCKSRQIYIYIYIVCTKENGLHMLL